MEKILAINLFFANYWMFADDPFHDPFHSL